MVVFVELRTAIEIVGVVSCFLCLVTDVIVNLTGSCVPVTDIKRGL